MHKHPFLSAFLVGGAIGGAFDAGYAVVYYGATRGVPAGRIWQHVASGLLGPGSFGMGGTSVAIGLLFHFTIALTAAAFYCNIALRVPGIASRPLLWGPSFGLGLYIFMNYVVIPLSRVAKRTAPQPWDVVLTGVLVHMFLIGLPIALSARHFLWGNRVRATVPATLVVAELSER